MNNGKMTYEQKAQARALWENTDTTVREIGAQLGVAPNTISSVACRGGWVKHGKSPKPTTEKIAAMRKDGNSYSQIADALGVSKNVVQGMIYRHAAETVKPRDGESRTLFDRCDALAAKMDAVLAECAKVPRVPVTTNQRPALTWGLPRSIARGTMAND